MGQDSPATAQAIVIHGESLCEREDHLWDVLDEVSIPVDVLTDRRDQAKVDFETEEMVRAFLHKEVCGFCQNELADKLGNSASLTKSFGFDITDLEEVPTQQDFSYVWGRFSDDTQYYRECRRGYRAGNWRTQCERRGTCPSRTR
jgi:hypothetical protein